MQIPNGWTNSFSIVWLFAYYVYWCIFVRYIQQHPPYFSLVRIFNGLIPSSKIMFINISIYLIIAIVPFVPLFMGFRDKYLEFFEKYMEIMDNQESFFRNSFFYLSILLISPYTVIRPYLAFISSLIGKNRSIIDALKRTKGNYLKFVLYSALISAPFFISGKLNEPYEKYITMFIATFLPIYFNVVFIDIYKVFYKRKAKQLKN